jgi:hypothetical protein
MAAQQSTYTLVDYTYNPTTDVHEYTFRDGSRKAVDEWYELLGQAYQQATASGTDYLRILVDISQANQPPLSYAFQKAKELIKLYPDVPPRRIAFIGTSSVLPTLLKPFIRLLRSELDFNYFQPHAKIEAHAWLSQNS